MTTRWKITIEYDGGNYHGWQIQENAVTVQEVIEKALYRFSGEKVELAASGRTDAGVHARAQIAHFDLERDTDPVEIIGALNHYLREETISILQVVQVDSEFHSRFHAKSRSYRYLIINRRPPLALNDGRAWHVTVPLDTDIMQEAANMLIGKHDFSTFRATDCQSKSPVKTLSEAKVEKAGELVSFQFRAPSFMYHQVRNIVGTLKLVGGGRWDLNQFKAAFEAKDRTRGGQTAPASGLFFWDVEY